MGWSEMDFWLCLMGILYIYLEVCIYSYIMSALVLLFFLRPHSDNERNP